LSTSRHIKMGAATSGQQKPTIGQSERRRRYRFRKRELQQPAGLWFVGVSKNVP
jgi:hypothetical protein